MKGVTRLFSLGMAAMFALLISIASHAAMMDFFMPNGQKVQGEVVGNKLMLKGVPVGMLPAPDGTYRGRDGKSIIVHNGIIIQGGMPNPAATKMLNPQPLPPAGGNQVNGDNKANRGGIIVQGGITNPGEAKGFNPQPDPPGKPTGIIAPTDSKGIVSPRDAKGLVGPSDSKASQGKK